jgi:hypothetical protein
VASSPVAAVKRGRVADNPDEHLAGIASYLDAGYDEVFVNQIGPEQKGFFAFYRREVLPQLGA